MAAIEERADCVAVMAAGVRGGPGPWRLVTARYDLLRKEINSFNCRHWLDIEAGAVAMCEAGEWASRVRAAAEAMVVAPASDIAPWFICAEQDLMPLLRRAAASVGARVRSWDEYCQWVEAQVARDLNS